MARTTVSFLSKRYLVVGGVKWSGEGMRVVVVVVLTWAWCDAEDEEEEEQEEEDGGENTWAGRRSEGRAGRSAGKAERKGKERTAAMYGVQTFAYALLCEVVGADARAGQAVVCHSRGEEPRDLEEDEWHRRRRVNRRKGGGGGGAGGG
jgi:hypothetical protein